MSDTASVVVPCMILVAASMFAGYLMGSAHVFSDWQFVGKCPEAHSYASRRCVDKDGKEHPVGIGEFKQAYQYYSR